MVRHRSRVPSARIRGRLVSVVLCLLVTVTACGGGPDAGEGQAGQRTTEGAPGAASTVPRSPDAENPTGTTSAPSPTESGTSSSAAAPTRFAVVGDSITSGVLPIQGRAVLGSNSWIPAATKSPRVEFVGGWAAPGATTTEMVAGVQPMAADVLVVLAGTNDLAKAAAWPVTEANLLQIGATAGVPTVLLSAVPPRNTAPAQTRQLNAHLEQLARTHGWAFVDPWADMSTDGAWMAETSDDGIHPNEQVAALVGDRLAAAIAAASRSPQP